MRTLAKMAWIELKLFGREPINLVFTLAFPFITLFVLGGVFGTQPRQHSGGELLFRGFGPMDYYAPAYIALISASIGLVSMPVHLSGYRERGILRRFRASSIPERALVGSQIGVTFAIVVASALVITAAAVAAYNIDVPKHIPQLALAFVISTATFAVIGAALGLTLPTARAAQGLGLLLFFIMFMLSGAGPPPELLSDPLEWVSKALPLTYAIRLLQNPWLGLNWDYASMGVVLGFAIVAAGAAYLRLRRD